jgi:TRAP-type mannitol/chloroaromatic compound transport system substrate-binding protein
MNLAKWNELPKAYQSAVTVASGDTWAWVLGKYDALNPPALKRLLAGGAQLRAFPQDVMEACYKAANDVYAELSQTNPMFKRMFGQSRALPQRLLSLDPSRRDGLRQFHGAHAHPELRRKELCRLSFRGTRLFDAPGA